MSKYLELGSRNLHKLFLPLWHSKSEIVLKLQDWFRSYNHFNWGIRKELILKKGGLSSGKVIDIQFQHNNSTKSDCSGL